MGESRMISTYKEKVWYRNELKIGVAQLIEKEDRYFCSLKYLSFLEYRL